MVILRAMIDLKTPLLLSALLCVAANFITYLRTALIIPTLCMLSWRWWVPASLTIILVDFGDFLDGVVARYWVDKKKEEKAKKDAAKDKVDSDDDSFGECLDISIRS
jgi:hypothetical protein